MATANSTVARSIRVYHATSSEAADAIEREGFRDARDARGTHLIAEAFSGVWVADLPLDSDEGPPSSDAFFIINIPEPDIADFEFVEEDKPYREWLIPADLLNRYPRVRTRC